MRQYTFRSSRNPAVQYVTTVHDNGVIQCNCPSFRQCWHVRRVIEMEETGERQIGLKVSLQDRYQLRALLEEGNDDGARLLVHDLFPQISEEETDETIENLMQENIADWNDKEI